MHMRHNSREGWFRSPQGAVTAGTEVRLRLLVEEAYPPARVELRLWQAGETRMPMRPMGAVEGRWAYEAKLPCPVEPCLMWYRFEAFDPEGQRWVYGNAADGLGGLGQMGNEESFQLTVYDPTFDPPHWLREGVMYQIFPDRFRRHAAAGPCVCTQPDAQAHAGWDESPTLNINAHGDNQALDFFGGTLAGIQEKLPYLKELGVTVIYLNPIFQARSNHRYDTGDYHAIDPLLGSQGDFEALCQAAAAMGIRVMLDGVFSHVGSDSRYFNRYGRYPGLGAYQSKQSPYASWFTFEQFPDVYACWWGFPTLPAVQEMDPGYLAYTLTDKHAVVPYWLGKGASGWRLDVADELPMAYLRTLRQVAKAKDPQTAVLGEVWEEASNKVAYGQARSYVLGDSLDTVMNYPLREAAIDFLLGRAPAGQLKRRIEALQEQYPMPFFYALMNLMGSHDRPRILNTLVQRDGNDMPRWARAGLKLTAKERELGKARLKLMLALMVALPGMPTLYYGDEVGMEGAADPFCRGTYPWGREDNGLLGDVKGLLALRRVHPVLRTGLLSLLAPCEDVLVVVRRVSGGLDVFGQTAPEGTVVIALNRGPRPCTVYMPTHALGIGGLVDSQGKPIFPGEDGFELQVPGLSAAFYHHVSGGQA